jgi:hypothetical protein
VLVGEPVVVQANVALVEVVELAGAPVSETVGATVPLELDVTCQLYVAEALPAELETVTWNVWPPTPSPL